MKYFLVHKIFIPGCFLILLLYLFLFPTQAFGAACDGLDLWFHTLLPSLLPFCVLSNILITAGIIPKLLKPFQRIFKNLLGLTPYGAYALFLGLLCGYPMGAKITGDLYRQQKISQQEGNYLLTISNHASPMFLTTYVVLHLFENQVSLPQTFFILYSSAFLTLLVFRLYFNFSAQRKAPKYTQTITAQEHSASITDTNCPITIEIVDDAIFNGFETITKLGGYIILFSICSSLLQQVCIPVQTLQWLLPCMTELTTGLHLLKKTALPFNMKYLMALTFTSFGGISTIAQTKGMLFGTPFRISTYVVGKIVNALITFVLAILFFFF